MTFLVEVLGAISITGIGTATAFLACRAYDNKEKLEARIASLVSECDSLKIELASTTLALSDANKQVDESLAKQERLASDVADLTNLSSQYVIDREASRKALEAETRTRVEFQNEAHLLKVELDSVRRELDGLREKHTRLLATRNEIVRDLGAAQIKLEEWQERWDAHQRMQTTTEQKWHSGLDERDQLREEVARLSSIIANLQNVRPARGRNGRFMKRTTHNCITAC